MTCWLCSSYTWTLVQHYYWTQPYSSLGSANISFTPTTPPVEPCSFWSEVKHIILRWLETPVLEMASYEYGQSHYCSKCRREELEGFVIITCNFLKRLHVQLWTGADCMAENPFRTLSYPIHVARFSQGKKASPTWYTLTVLYMVIFLEPFTSLQCIKWYTEASGSIRH